MISLEKFLSLEECKAPQYLLKFQKCLILSYLKEKSDFFPV